MRSLRCLCSAVALSCLLLASGVDAEHEQVVFQSRSRKEGLRVAIVGAGAAGSFSAYSLAFLEDAYGSEKAEVDLFEKEPYVGGRSTIVEIPGGYYAELGASIFVKANKNLMHAVNKFNLTLQDGHGEGHEINDEMAIYNGEEFVYQQTGYAFGYWDIAKILWKYGTSPIKVRSAMKQLLSVFEKSYDFPIHSTGPFRTIEEWAESLNFTSLYRQTTNSYLSQVSAAFLDDFVAAGTTVNYAQTPQTMHALEGLVSVAAEGASSVVGGNRRIFGEFAQRSGANIHLQTSVDSITKMVSDERTAWELTYTGNDGLSNTKIFDVVILAAPLHQTGIHFNNTKAASLALKTEYVQLHVTLLVTNATAPRSCFFNPEWPCDKAGPRSVLTTLSHWEQGKVRMRPRVNSLNYLKQVGEGEWVVKLFSMERLSDAELDEAFGSGSVLWTYRKEWLSYPYVPPISKFSPISLDDGFYYANTMEPLISTMETETISAWNIARLIMLGYHDVKVDKSWPEWNVDEL